MRLLQTCKLVRHEAFALAMQSTIITLCSKNFGSLEKRLSLKRTRFLIKTVKLKPDFRDMLHTIRYGLDGKGWLLLSVAFKVLPLFPRHIIAAVEKSLGVLDWDCEDIISGYGLFWEMKETAAASREREERGDMGANGFNLYLHIWVQFLENPRLQTWELHILKDGIRELTIKFERESAVRGVEYGELVPKRSWRESLKIQDILFGPLKGAIVDVVERIRFDEVVVRVSSPSGARGMEVGDAVVVRMTLVID